jgi:RNA polymerase sigma-70 factor (ECF subfamily)
LTDVQRLRQQDQAAWDALIETHRQVVFRLAYLLLGDADDAEDVAQETFIRAYRHIERFDVSREMRPWLLRIAANLARNKRRSVARFLTALQRLVLAQPELTQSPSLEHQATEALQAQRLWQAVRRLPQPDQEVIYLRHFLEVSEAEASEALGVAVGTVKSRTHRALARLRKVVEADFSELKA